MSGAPSLRACRKYGERNIHADDLFVCTLDDSELDSEHDELLLNLFAAAPELLATLKLTPLDLHGADERGPCLCSQCEFRRAAAAAIAKAEGRVA